MLLRQSSIARGLLLAAVVAVCNSAVPSISLAQARDKSSTLGMAHDSTAARIVAAAIYGQLGQELTRAATDTTLRAWIISLPADSLNAVWREYRAHMALSLRAKDTTSSDSTRGVIVLGEVKMAGDTLIAAFGIGGMWRCGTEWKGSSTSWTMRVPRFTTGWQDAQTRPNGFSDSVPCRKSP